MPSIFATVQVLFRQVVFIQRWLIYEKIGMFFRFCCRTKCKVLFINITRILEHLKKTWLYLTRWMLNTGLIGKKNTFNYTFIPLIMHRICVLCLRNECLKTWHTWWDNFHFCILSHNYKVYGFIAHTIRSL